MPTLSELQTLRQESDNSLPPSWGGVSPGFTYWTSDKTSTDRHTLFSFADGQTYDRADTEEQFFAVKAFHPAPSSIAVESQSAFDIGSIYATGTDLNVVFSAAGSFPIFLSPGTINIVSGDLSLTATGSSFFVYDVLEASAIDIHLQGSQIYGNAVS